MLVNVSVSKKNFAPLIHSVNVILLCLFGAVSYAKKFFLFTYNSRAPINLLCEPQTGELSATIYSSQLDPVPYSAPGRRFEREPHPVRLL